MAVSEYFQDMNDVGLKPRLLRSLLKNHLPDDKHPIHNPSELSGVISAIKTHGLLSESFSKPVEGKIMEKWKSTVDDWVKELLTLVSSKMPDKCWVGICLLGVTCQECSDDRFLLTYSSLFQELLSHIQPPSDSHFVKVAACASLSDLFTRLAGFSTLKKDAILKCGKLIQPILKLLAEEVSESVLEGAADLLSTLMNFFPSSVHRHYESAESVIVSKIMSGKSSANISKKFAQCLALLPKTKGDEESWSIMMQKILISVSDHLSDAFQGLEEETTSSEVKRLLVPPGKDPPPPLGGQLSLEASNQLANRSERMVLSTVYTLMMCCHTMLTSPYPVQIPVPVRPLLALITRVLTVDGSVLQALMPFTTVMQQELVCMELPDLHSYNLDLLSAIIKGVHSQLLPYSADIVRLLTEYFKICALPVLRIKVYSIVQILLISMGVGITQYLSEEVINNALADLDFVGTGVVSSTPYSNAVTYTLRHPSSKKRKQDNSTGEHQRGVCLEMDLPKSKPTAPISVQIAALQALEALLAVGGAMISGSQRSNVDLLLITVATNTSDGGCVNKEKTAVIPSGELTSALANFQLAALRALWASLLSSARVRPDYLSQGLELFRRGRQQTGTKVAEFCVLALLALEVLIHPRTLPLTHYHSSNHETFDEGYNRNFATNALSGSDQHNTSFSRGALGMDDLDPDDDLYKSWLGNGEETEAPVRNADHEMKGAGELLRKDVQRTNPNELIRDVEMAGSRDKALVGSQRSVSGSDVVTDRTQRVEVPASGSAHNVGTSVDKGSEMKGALPVREKERDMKVTSSDLSGHFENASSNINTISGGDSTVAVEGATSITATEPFSGKGKVSDLNSDSDSDSFPDIVDGDPDME